MIQDKIFISYSHNDSEWAKKFAGELKELGLNVWFDQFNVEIGKAWADSIGTALKESNIVIFLVREEDLETTGVTNANLYLELGAAISMGKIIIPVVPEEVDQNKLPWSLRLVRGITRTTPEETAKRLSESSTTLSKKAA